MIRTLYIATLFWLLPAPLVAQTTKPHTKPVDTYGRAEALYKQFVSIVLPKKGDKKMSSAPFKQKRALGKQAKTLYKQIFLTHSKQQRGVFALCRMAQIDEQVALLYKRWPTPSEAQLRKKIASLFAKNLKKRGIPPQMIPHILQTEQIKQSIDKVYNKVKGSFQKIDKQSQLQYSLYMEKSRENRRSCLDLLTQHNIPKNKQPAFLTPLPLLDPPSSQPSSTSRPTSQPTQ
ncbi:MAG TPA: hypothetical protein DCE42_11775 [Myxococcales bacterium]|nr:hypothetical protein [Deltaproteobacteria bacterium]MBU53004.1 hypothetical protein [Deltaproteobacteria bacterium]HAA55429.1 hypothetical protein [Myxococcales bacterium]|tara:strand:- start:7808 stop:8503 length:696 start_codon:yes stop_codon:yes gene_type:complete